MPGPNSWGAAKKRQRRPETADAKASNDQETGKVLFTKKIRLLPTPLRKTKKKSGDEKRLRGLNKKLRKIEALGERLAAGEELDEQQQAKFDSLDAVLADMAKMGVPDT